MLPERVLLSGYERTLNEIEKDLQELKELEIDYTSTKTLAETLEKYYVKGSVSVDCMLSIIRAFKKSYLVPES